MDESSSPPKKLTKAQRIAAAYERMKEAEAELDELEDDATAEGRRTKYKPEFAARVTDMCLLGLTNGELAERFKVSEATIDLWISTIPAFQGAVYAGREGADQKVANALFKSAIGYTHDHEDIRTEGLGGGESRVVVTKTTKHYPPNDASIGRWMRARQNTRFPNPNADASASSPTDLVTAAKVAIRAALATMGDEDKDKEDSSS